MLRIIVGQDPYPDRTKQLKISNYPSNPVAFFQPNWNTNEPTFHRVVGLIHSKGEPTQLTTSLDVLNLANRGLFLFNAYKGHVQINNQSIMYGPNDVDIISFAIQYWKKFKLAKNDVHFLLCGEEAIDLLYNQIDQYGFNAYRAPHPSSKNPRGSVLNFWINKSNYPGQYYIDSQTALKYFQVD